ncbi:MAG: MurR/RpiR family transcriptional regulator [Burkholderiaceae bacterium]|nr:MurR/RpiR family transcriptional regulator [Burkholderiaceae bacterium]
MDDGAEPTAVHRLTRAYAALTPRQRQIADHVLAHRFEAATLAIDALARRCEVSVASANRFVRALGYASYAGFREHWQHQLMAGEAPGALARLRAQADDGAGPVLRGALRQGLQSLQRAQADLDDEQAQGLLDALLRAPRVAVFGAEVSAYMAGYFVNYLSLFRGDVEGLAGMGGATEPYRRLLAYDEQDLLLVLSLPRYSKLTLELSEFAAARGIPVAAITDRPAAPVVKLARHVLYAPAGDSLLPASSLSMLALLEGLCSAVGARSPRLARELPQLSHTMAAHYVDATP